MEVRRVIHDAHDSSVLCVTFNQHRRELITGGQDGAIKTWEGDTGKHLRTLVDGHLGWVTGLVYAGALRMCFSTSIDSHLIVWDTRAKCEWFQKLKMEAQGHCVEYDERRALVYVGSHTVVRVYAVQREHADEPSRRRDRPILKWAQTIKGVHDDYVRAIVCTESGRLFSAGYDASLCFYDVADSTGARPAQFSFKTQRNCHAGAISSAAFDWENNLVITGSFDRSVKVWSPEGKLLQTFGPFADTLTGLCYAPASCELWMSANSAAPIIYDPRTGTNVTAFKQPPSVRTVVHGGLVGAEPGRADESAAAAAARAATAAAAADDESRPSARLLRLFSMRGSNEVVGATSARDLIIWRYNPTGAASVLVGHTDWVEVVGYMRALEGEVTADEPQVRLFSAGADGLVRTWEPATRLNAALYAQTGKAEGHTGAVLCGAFCDEANAFVTGSDDATIRAWFQPTTTAAVAAVRAKHRRAAAAEAGVEDEASEPSPRGGTAAARAPADGAPADGVSADGAHVHGAPADEAHGGGPPALEADGAAAPADDPAAVAAAVEYVEATCTVLRGHEEKVTGVAVLGPPSPPCTIVSVSWDLSIRWWRLLPDERGEPLLHTIENAHDDYINGVAYSPLTHQIATCSSDQGVKIWDASRKALAATLSGHLADVGHVAWSATHAVWVTGSDDSTIRIWSTLGRQLHTIDARDPVSALAIDFNWGYILAAVNDNTHALKVYYPGLDEAAGEAGVDEDSAARAGGGGGGGDGAGGTRAAGAAGAAGAGAGTAGGSAREERERAREREPYLLHSHRGHSDCIRHILHIPEKAQYVTASWDHTLRTWRQAPARRRFAAGSTGGTAAAVAAPRAAAAGADAAAAPARAAAAAASAELLGGGSPAGGGSSGHLSFADRYPLQVPKALQNEYGGFEYRPSGGGAGQALAGASSRRRQRKVAEPPESTAGQSGMALRLNELLADREVVLETQLLMAGGNKHSPHSAARAPKPHRDSNTRVSLGGVGSRKNERAPGAGTAGLAQPASASLIGHADVARANAR